VEVEAGVEAIQHRYLPQYRDLQYHRYRHQPHRRYHQCRHRLQLQLQLQYIR
jgi:hypothetical protein